MSEQPLLFDLRDGIALIRLNRPEAGNALDLNLAQALVDASIQCQTDGSIRCVVLQGTGQFFALAETSNPSPAPARTPLPFSTG